MSRSVALAAALLLGAAALAPVAPGSANTLEITVRPRPAPEGSRVSITVSGAIGEPGTFEVADFEGRGRHTCAETLANAVVTFGQKVTHVLTAPGPFSFAGSTRTARHPGTEVLCAVLFPDPHGTLREENAGQPIEPTLLAEVRYAVGHSRSGGKHCKRTRHHACKRARQKK
jgi:hypothetical protein